MPVGRQRGLIRNDGGRVSQTAAAPGEYAVGWIKRGPSGVIGTNKKDAADTVARILEDADAPPRARRRADARSGSPSARPSCDVGGLAGDRRGREGAGEAQGRPRVKMVRLSELVEAGRATAAR